MTAPTPEQWQQGEQDFDARLGPALSSAVEELRPLVEGPEQWNLQPETRQAVQRQHNLLQQRLQILRLVWMQRTGQGKPMPWWKLGLVVATAPVAVFAALMAFLAVVCLGSATVFLWAPFLLVWLLRKDSRSH
jgi:hypothetical protein